MTSEPKRRPGSDPPSACEDVAKLRLELNHVSLEELEAKGVVEWDRNDDVVRKGPDFDTYWRD